MRKYSVQKDQIVMDISHEQNGRRWWPYLKDVVVVIVIAFNTGLINKTCLLKFINEDTIETASHFIHKDCLQT